MAKDDGYQGALDSIFGFIFSNNSGDSKPLKPPKPTGESASNDFAGALTELAAKPGTYLSEQTLDRLNDAIDADIIRFDLDSETDAEVRVRVKDLGKMLVDPNKYFDDKVKKLMTKTDASVKDLITGGPYLDQAIGYGVAKYKFKMDDKTASRIGMFAGKRDSMNSIGSMRSDGAKLIAQNAVMQSVGDDFSAADAKKIVDSIERSKILKFGKSDLESLLRSSGLSGVAGTVTAHFKSIEEGSRKDKYRMDHMSYGQLLNTNLSSRMKIASGDAKKDLYKAQILVESWTRLRSDLDRSSLTGFKKSLDSMDRDIIELRSSGNAEDQRILKLLIGERAKLEKINKKMKTGKKEGDEGFVDERPVWQLVHGKRIRSSKKVRDGLRAELAGRRLSLARELNATDPGDTGKIDFIKSQMGSLRTQEKSLVNTQLSEIAMRLGSYRKYSGYLKNFRKGEFNWMVAPGLIFIGDPSLNPGGPSKFAGEVMQTRNWRGKYNTEGVKYAYVTPRTDINPHHAALTGLYYITPGSLTKTFLYNGELFAYFAATKKGRVMGKMFEDKDLIARLAGDSRFADFLKEGADGEFDFDKINPKFLEFMDLLESDSVLAQKYGLKQFRRMYERNGSLARFFSLPHRVNQRWQTWFADKVQKKFNKGLAGVLGRRFPLKDPEWIANLAKFGDGKLGLRQLIQSGMTAAFAAVSGPIGVFLAWAGTELVMRALPGLIAGIMKGLVLVIWGVVFGAIGLGVIMTTILSGASSKTNAWDYQLPEDVTLLATENPYGPEINYIPEDDIPDLGDAPPGSTCPILGSLRCSQGPEGIAGEGTHKYMQTKAIDVVSDPIWYAPANGTVSSYSPSNTCSTGKDYGGILVFTDTAGNSYRLIHVKAVVSSGKVAKGKPVAIMRQDLEIDLEGCWTGSHFHLDTKVGGTWVNSEEWYRDKLGCELSICPPS